MEQHGNAHGRALKRARIELGQQTAAADADDAVEDFDDDAVQVNRASRPNQVLGNSGGPRRMSEQGKTRRRRGPRTRAGVSAAVRAVLENDKLVADWKDDDAYDPLDIDDAYNPLDDADAVEQDSSVSAGPATPDASTVVTTDDAQPMVVATCCDGVALRISFAVARALGTVKNLLDDTEADDSADVEVPLPRVTSEILSMVVRFVELPDPKPTVFPGAATAVSSGTLGALVRAANFLDASGLLSATINRIGAAGARLTDSGADVTATQLAFATWASDLAEYEETLVGLQDYEPEIMYVPLPCGCHRLCCLRSGHI